MDADSPKRAAIYPILIGGLTLLAANLPYLWAATIQHPPFVNIGLVWETTLHDALSYIAKMRQGAEGAWLYTNLYSIETERPVLIYTLYLVLGHATRILGLTLIGMYHASRVVFGAFFLWTAWRFLRVIDFPERMRSLAYLFLLGAEGVGWIFFLPWRRVLSSNTPQWVQRPPEELLLTEAFPFQTLGQHPHLILSGALMLGLLAELYRLGSGRSSKWSYAWIAAMGFLLGWANPRILLNVFAIALVAGVWGRAKQGWSIRSLAKGIACLVVFAAPPALAIGFSVFSDPLAKRWADPASPSPSPIWYLEAFGFLWPLAIYGAWRAIREREPWAQLIVAWLIVGSILPYIPITTQRRLVQGWSIPLGVLSAYALAFHAIRPRSPTRGFIIAAVTLFLLLTPFCCVGHGARRAIRGAFPPYIHQERAAAQRWLEQNTKREEVVLGSKFTSMFLPAFSGNRVVAGHWAETVDVDAKDREIASFFLAETSKPERIDFLSRNRVRFVFMSEWELRYAKERGVEPYLPESDPEIFRPVWKSPTITNYEVLR